MKKLIILSVLAVALTAVATELNRDLTKEATISTAVGKYMTQKKAFNEHAKKVLLETVLPLIKEAETLHEQGKVILTDVDVYLAASKVKDPNTFYDVVATEVNSDAMAENARMLDLLKVITVIVVEDVTNEKITDPALSLSVE